MATLQTSAVRRAMVAPLLNDGRKQATVPYEAFARTARTLQHKGFVCRAVETRLRQYDDRGAMGDEGMAETAFEITTAYQLRPNNVVDDIDLALDDEGAVIGLICDEMARTGLDLFVDAVTRRETVEQRWHLSTVRFRVFHRFAFD